MSTRIVVVGGGAAGFFGAIACARARPDAQVTILEGAARPLDKVRISGGGRCNLTHDCFDPRALVQHYPRGQRELLGPFHRFGPRQTVAWFAAEGVATKTEADGRMFPVTDRSETVMGALIGAADDAGVRLLTRQRLAALERDGAGWRATTRAGQRFTADRVLIATGASPRVWRMLAGLGLPIVPPVPSLFSFNTKDTRLAGLAGLSVPAVRLRISDTRLEAHGPLLVTHWGLSGPAVLRLSAWGARVLHARNHRFELRVQWTDADVSAVIGQTRHMHGKRRVSTHCPFALPARLWRSLVSAGGIDGDQRWGSLSAARARALREVLVDSRFPIRGKSTYKDEFVTAGGVDLKAMNFKHFEAKDLPGLHLAGEVLDIDAITGGFNFQAAWTGGWIAGHAMAE
jgi:predicted Rossmann fold flavoprotein